MQDVLLELEDVEVAYSFGAGGKSGSLKAVDGVSLRIYRGETLGLVGESGCGKSTLARCILGLVKPNRGRILLSLGNGSKEKIVITQKGNLRRVRRRIQTVFQDPYTSLNPRQKVKDIIGEPIVTHKMAVSLSEQVVALLNLVGMNKSDLNRYPHEFSGGQLQRICIARSISVQPDILILDEPTSALDVSVQIQILKLLKRLQKEEGLTYLFISHNLEVIDYMSDRVAVMYLGKIVEESPRDLLFRKPKHPYTEALLSAVPSANPARKRLDKAIELQGDVPQAVDPPLGCRFHTRCPLVFEECGWESRDMLAYLMKRLDFRGIVAETRGFELILKKHERILDNIKSELQSEEFLKSALGLSLEEVKVEEDRLVLRFPKTSEPILTDIGEEQRVACHLYKR